MPKFQFSRRAKWPWRDKMLGAPQRGQKIIVNPKQSYFSYSLDKAFYSPEFQAKYFYHAKLSGRFLLRQPLKNALRTEPIQIQTPKVTISP